VASGEDKSLECFPEKGDAQRLPDRDCWSSFADGCPPEGMQKQEPKFADHDFQSSARLGALIQEQPIRRSDGSGDPLAAVNSLRSHSLGDAGVISLQVTELSRIVLTEDISQAVTYLRAMQGHGLSLDVLCQDLLAPAARRLGEMWEQDLCHFADVTLALWRLQQVLRKFSEELPFEVPHRERVLTALLVGAPGEQHTFGLSMVMEYFRRAGWDLCGGPPVLLAELVGTVRDNWFDIVGFSVSSDKGLETLAFCIREVRLASRNPVIGVLVGGKVFVDQPELAVTVGADAIVLNVQQAPIHAEQLVANLAHRLG
jgi:methanogenic corrinoid protein MtbC1